MFTLRLTINTPIILYMFLSFWFRPSTSTRFFDSICILERLSNWSHSNVVEMAFSSQSADRYHSTRSHVWVSSYHQNSVCGGFIIICLLVVDYLCNYADVHNKTTLQIESSFFEDGNNCLIANLTNSHYQELICQEDAIVDHDSHSKLSKSGNGW